ncbi:MAG: VCBS repeat-containing protein, partial [Anaerolineae bacterium]|nr:VCBS repeat-containing protein [Anaerolineae bacterium]
MKRFHLWLGLILWGVIAWEVLCAFPAFAEPQVRATVSVERLALTEPISNTLTTLPQVSWAPDADSYALAWGDMDGDGDLDLAVGNYQGLNKVYLNVGGALQETPTWQALASDYTVSLAWGDMDNDGDLDLAVGNCGNLVDNEFHNTYVQVYLNVDGMLQSTPVWTSHYDGNSHRNTRSVAWGDMNGDGYLDLAVGNSGYQNDRANTYNQVYLNVNGMLAATPAWTSGVLADTHGVAWGDADGDGDLDLAVANSIHPNDDPKHSAQIYLNNNGALSPTPTWNVTLLDANSVLWGDYDRDGRLDLVLGGRAGVAIYRNDFPTFWDQWLIAVPGSYTVYSTAMGDADNDGDLDIAVGSGGTTLIHLTEADGYPAEEGQVVGNADARSVAWGDVDGDGDLDLAMGNVGGPSQLYVNNLPPYTYSGGRCFPDADISSLALGDVDNDGDLDLAVGFFWGNQPNVAYRNADGNLYSSVIWTPNAAIRATSLAWGDVDGDGYLDLAVGNTPSVVYRNQGGTLGSTPYWTATGTQSAASLAWGDLDGDGDLDLAAGGSQTVVYLNLGATLAATPVWTDTLWGNGSSVAWGDMDGDGDLDLAIGSSNYIGSRVYLNVNGRLQTTPIWTPADPFETNSVAWGDVDGDGDLDLALGHYEQPNRIYLNENGRLQTRPIWLAARSEGTWQLSWLDAEMDGDVDLLAGTAWSQWGTTSPSNLLLYSNLGSALHPRAITLPATGAATAWGPLNGDRLPDGVGHNKVWWCGEAGESAALTQALSRRPPAHPLYPALPATDLTLSLAHLTPASGYATTYIWGQAPILFTYTLASDGASPIISGYYSLNGGGKWLPAQPTTDTVTRDLVVLGPTLDFNGSSHYVWHNTSPITGGDFTIEFWFNSTQVVGTADHWEHGMGLVDSSGTTGLGRDDYGISLAEGKVLFGVGSTTTDTVLVGPFAADGRWHYVAATRRAADGALSLYLDGEPVASGVGSTANRWSS